MPQQLLSPEIQAFATGFPITLLHASLTVLILLLGSGLYVMLTPHREIALIREGNTAAALSLAGVMLGLALPLGVSLHVSTSLAEIGVWGVSTVIVQLLVFRIVDLILRGLPQRIQEGEMAAATVLVGTKLATAVILASAVAG